MKFVLQVLLALLIAIGASPTSAAVRVQATDPCEHATTAPGITVARDDCGRAEVGRADLGKTDPGRADHGHCIGVSGGCCAFAPWPSASAAPRTATSGIVWTIGTDLSPDGHSFAPATPPPRV